ncbi:MAG TPA: hypothetical protein VL383_03515, partial [Gemmatimonadaceae bacterium]|nr:hypothetical protein [Gemmatimonadaceae bacterium]
MSVRATHLFGLIAAAGIGTGTIVSAPHESSSPRELIAHEWGTFTTVAGENGAAIDWLPLGGPSDLPCFVEHFQNKQTIKIAPEYAGGPVIDYDKARSSLLGRVRMETPVLYFYGGQDTTLNIKVRFPHGLMTEWYPHANVVEMIIGPNTLKQNNPPATIEWSNVRLTPRATPNFPGGDGASHYYAARATEASPLAVADQRERFLFYRGVADFDASINATALPNGRVRIGRTGDDVSGVILFERRGNTLGFRVLGTVRGDTTVDAPSLDGSLTALHDQLASSLTAAGLFPKEASAMLETWRDSWFEAGTRVFYIVPSRRVDAILPLEVRPAPHQVTRVFVGRMEVITPTTESAVQRALTTNDAATLARYARFLGPITDRLLAKMPSVSERDRVRSATNAA